MRIVVAIPLCLSLIACTSTPVTAPREYLDEQTAATITVVNEPWIFTRVPGASEDGSQRDYLHLYAIDVNRMVDHRQYFAALQSAPAGSASTAPILELTNGLQAIKLDSTNEDPRELGIAQPIAEAYTPNAAWWYFPVDKQTLSQLANSRNLEAKLIAQQDQFSYVLWRDGRDELSELTAVLP